MPESLPSRESPKSGVSVSQSDAPNPFGAPSNHGAESDASLNPHHSAPQISTGKSRSTTWAEVVDTLPYGLVILDRRQELRHENSTCRQLSGYGVAESGGFEEWLTHLCPTPDQLDEIVATWRDQLWRNQRPITLLLKTRDESLRTFEFQPTLLQDGGIVLTITDVSGLVQLEEARRSDKFVFQALLSHTSTASIITNRSGRIIRANPAFLRLSGYSASDLRQLDLSDLILDAEARSLLTEAASLIPSSPTDYCERRLTLRTRNTEREAHLIAAPIGGANREAPRAILCLFDVGDTSVLADSLRLRLSALSRKTQALLQAIPDLILLIDGDDTIADFASPPEDWEEISPDSSWIGRPIQETWPALGNVLEECRQKIGMEGSTVHADIRSLTNGGYEFSATLTACGEGQILIVVRNQSHLRHLRERNAWQSEAFAHSPSAILHLDSVGMVADANVAASDLLQIPESRLQGQSYSESILPKGVTSEFLALEQEGKTFASLVFLRDAVATQVSAPEAESTSSRVAEPVPAEAPTPPPSGELHSLHHFRNQLQLVTSLFSLEPQGAEARDAFVKWQVRLRAIAQACPSAAIEPVRISTLLRNLADQVCSLLNRGPGRRCVIVTGDESLSFGVQTATPFALLMGEILRLVLSSRQVGPGPDLYLDLRPDSSKGFQLIVRPGAQRNFVFTNEEAELEILELLSEQISGRLEVTDPEHPYKEWILIVPEA